MMRTGFPCLLVVILMTGQLWSQPARDVEAFRILRNVIEAHGGEAALARLGDTVISGRAIVPTPGGGAEEYSITVKTRGIHQLRTEITGPEGHRIYISNGRVGWVVENGEKKLLSGEQAGDRLIEINPLALLTAFLHSQLEVQHAEIVSIEDSQFYLLEFLHRRRDPKLAQFNRPYEILVESGTYRIAEISYPTVSAQGIDPDSVVSFVFSDYQAAEGILVPWRVDRYFTGRLLSTITLDSFAPADHGAIFPEP